MEQQVLMWIGIGGALWATIKFFGQTLKIILVEPLKTSINSLSKAVEKLNERFEEQRTEMEKTRGEILVIKRDMNTLFKRYDELVKEVRKNNDK